MENKPARRALIASAAALMLALFTGPAFANHAEDHEAGPPREEETSSSSSTEETSSEEQSSSSSDGTSSRQGSASHDSHPTEDTDDSVPNDPAPGDRTVSAHPSGNDKYVEAGGSGNQGWATSEPDQNLSGPERDAGGRDQPGGPGGVDIHDQDGNNGCGNDQDFEDDNEGLCRGPQPPTITDCPAGGCPNPPPCPQGGCPNPCPQGGCPNPCPQGGCPNPCPQGGCPTENPPIVAAVTPGPPPEGPVAPAGVPGGGDDDVAGPAAPVPVPELAFTGVNLDFLLRGMLILALAGALLATLGRREGRREEEI